MAVQNVNSSVRISGSDEDYTNSPRGGVATISTNFLETRLTSTSVDPLCGRWIHNSYRGKGHNNLHIITAYRSCENNDPGLLTWHMQQARALLQAHRTNCKPREIFLSDLKTFIDNLKLHRQEKLIICLDANEDMSDNQGLKQFADSLGLLCVQQAILGNNHPTFVRGTKVIDHMLFSSNLTDSINSFTVLKGTALCNTDHHCLLLDLYVDGTFKNTASSTHPCKSFKLSSKNEKTSQAYKKKVLMNVDSHNILDRTQQLWERSSQPFTSEDEEEYQKLDDLITHIMLKAENSQSKPRPNTPWSPKIAAIKSQIRSQTAAPNDPLSDLLTKAHKRKRLLNRLNKINPDRLRDKHMTDLGDHAVRVRQSEKQSRIFKTLTPIFGKLRASRVRRVEIPENWKPSENEMEKNDRINSENMTDKQLWKVVMDKNNVEELIINRN